MSIQKEEEKWRERKERKIILREREENKKMLQRDRPLRRFFS